MSAGEFLQPWAHTGDGNKNYSGNIDYGIGVNVLVEWVANFTNATIALWQDNLPGDAQGGPSVNLEESYNETTWGWKVSYEGLDPAYNDAFYLAVSDSSGNNGFSSRYFNITDNSSTISSSPSASSISELTAYYTTSMPTSLTSSQPPSRATVTLVPSNDSGTSVGTVAGIAVGTVVGASLLLGAAWFVWKLMKRRTTATRAQSSNAASDLPELYVEQKPLEIATNQISHESDANPIHEMYDVNGRPAHELHEAAK